MIRRATKRLTLGMLKGLPSVREPNQVVVLCYHRTPCRTAFEQQMQVLLSEAQPLSLAQFDGWRRGELTFDQARVLLTFDDATTDQFVNAVPVLKSLGMPAVFFPVTGHIGGLSNWWHEFAGTVEVPLMNLEQLQSLSAEGFEIGSHTHSHQRLTTLSREQCLNEIGQSKTILEQVTGRAVTAFCYPYGLNNADVVSVIKQAGFTMAFTTLPGFVAVNDDPYLLRRMPVWGTPNRDEFGMHLSGKILRYWNLRRRVPFLR